MKIHDNDIGHGYIRLQTPCSVSWNSMDPAEGGNRHCQSCSKVVHNISAMSPEQIIALLRTDPGNVCVNYVQFHFPSDTDKKQPPTTSKPVRKRNIRFAAAAASLLLLAQQGQTTAPFRPKTHFNAGNPQMPNDFLPTNTLVSGNVRTTLGDLIPHDVEVTIYKGHRELARVMTRAGLFFIDLKGLAEPTDTITLSIQPGPLQTSPLNAAPIDSAEACPDNSPKADLLPLVPSFYPWEPGMPFAPASYHPDHRGLIYEIVLADAQNVDLRLDWTISYFPVSWNGGVPMINPQLFIPETFMATHITISMDADQSVGPRDSQDYSCTDLGRP